MRAARTFAMGLGALCLMLPVSAAFYLESDSNFIEQALPPRASAVLTELRQSASANRCPRFRENDPLVEGEVLFRSLRGDPGLGYYLYVPRAGGKGARLLVAVHGVSENAREHVLLFSSLAERHRAVLIAPCFSSRRFPGYQRLGTDRRDARADLALDGLSHEVGRLTGAATDRLFLFGYSGGAQFAHRYAMAHPERVGAAVVASAGWYTFPDPSRTYPYGIKTTRALPGIRFEPREFLTVPMLVTVGEQDVERDANLRRSAELDRQQGSTRLERAARWVRAMREAARRLEFQSPVELRKLPGMEHSFAHNMKHSGLAEEVARFLFDREGPKGSVVAAGLPHAESEPRTAMTPERH